MLDLRQLRYFIAVAETENVGRAAAQLHISQSPLSRQIKQLEEQLGVLLFERSKKRIRLTQEGRDLLGEARTLLANANRVETFARRLGTGNAGRLAVGYVEGAMYANVVSPSVRAFRIASPSVTLSLQALGTAVQFEYLRRHMLDVGLAYRMPERESGLSGALVLEDAGFTPDIAYETSDPLASLYLVSSGLGVTLVQSALKDNAPAGIVFRDLKWLNLRVKIHLIWRSDDVRPIVSTFRDAVSTFMGSAFVP